ncbi:unnamed protein product [Calypogeia fissa]
MTSGTLARLPRRVIDDMRQLGGDYCAYGSGRSSLHIFEVTLGDAVHHVYADYCAADSQDSDTGSSGDPLIHFVCPGDDWGVVPHPAVQCSIGREVNSILVAYQPLRAHHFCGGAPIPLGPPVGLPERGLFFRHSTIAAHAVPERIGDPH